MLLQQAPAPQFLADPIGHFAVGPGYLVWCADQHLGGSALWSEPLREEQVQQALPLFDRRHEAMCKPVNLLTDGRLITTLDPTAYRVLSEYFVSRWAAHADQVHRHAVIVPGGLAGAAIAGTYLRSPEQKIRVFEDPAAAFDWVGASAVLAQIEALIADATGVTPVVRALREHLAQHLMAATIETAAHAIGVSTRSLQRQLGYVGTTFRDELDHARVRAAKPMLRDTEDKLDAIAARVGLSSGSHLNTVFRRVTGQPPRRQR